MVFDPDGNSGGNDAVLHTALSNLTDNQWHYITCTRNQTTGDVKLYVDGDVVSSATTITGTIVSPNAFVIGSHVWTDRSFYEGGIDNFNFWNKVLSQSEIQSTMNNGLSGNEEGLVGYWNFNEGNGNVLTDLSANGNDGTIFGASWGDRFGSNGVFTYSPNYNFYGSDSFTYTVSDGSATSEEATVSLTINSVIDKYHVATTGSDDNNGSSNSPFATIQAGINAAEDSDTIFVASGTYTENINLNGKNIYIEGAAAATTIIDGGENGSVVQAVGGEGSGTTLSKFTLQNGLATYGGGVEVDNSSTLNLLDVILKAIILIMVQELRSSITPVLPSRMDYYLIIKLVFKEALFIYLKVLR